MNLLANLFNATTKHPHTAARRTARLQVERLETRDLLSGTALASVTDLVLDPFNPAATSHYDNEWKYVTVRRTAVVETPASAENPLF